MKLLATLFLAVLALVATPAPAADPVYVIRHLEKAEGKDPPLTAQGAERAGKLADLLADKGIKAVYATATKRAQQTAQPLATRLGIAVATYDPAKPEALVEAAKAAGGSVLVVGHSNTVPDLVAAFGGARPEPISEDSFGTLFLVGADKSVTMIVVD